MLKNKAGIFELCKNAMLHCETCSVKNSGYRYIQIIEATHSSSQCRSMRIGGTPPPNHRSSLKPAAPPPAAGFFLFWASFSNASCGEVSARRLRPDDRYPAFPLKFPGDF
ncbi:hypothetical protein AGROH133_12939 [Agrobacterium tumefaciens]|nr:hypothetical protein AGROH133_12939 [Agrobacterium tumefaciens]